MSSIKNFFDGVFRWVWRINGVLLLALLVFALIVFSLIPSGFHPGRNEVAQEGSITPHTASHPHVPALHLGLMRDLSGTPMLYAPLKAADPDSTVSFSGSVSTQVHNVLFFDMSTKQEHWLFKNNRQVISRPEVLEHNMPAPSANMKPAKKAVGLIFGVRRQTGDPTSAALWDIELASVDGRRVTTLASDVDAMMGFHFADGTRALLVFYTSHGAAHVLNVDLETHKVLSTRKLATPL
ncbi:MULTISPECIES: hypothetical protein [Oleiagrimonas]|uniref:Uncharacterized protein n=1 Tax=Oleiagrimonas citrea TaxID=1665687 RepID=A0A846ZM03_9GAMM|nr:MULTISPECIES: hypothetical protein [Oleiagrimonas]NKZ38473.1 hypothetical protein [Oleiagrimonas citrea]RAP58272.1 hypothetical protein BTJ49_04715 [Oleiagrimonas sp. MCCC 1A03011]